MFVFFHEAIFRPEDILCVTKIDFGILIFIGEDNGRGKNISLNVHGNSESLLGELYQIMLENGLAFDDEKEELPEMDDTAAQILQGLLADGYNYVARDANGKLYAYRNKPSYIGNMWSESGNDENPQLRDACFDPIEAYDEPVKILELLLGR